jgi:hypothetical protein
MRNSTIGGVVVAVGAVAYIMGSLQGHRDARMLALADAAKATAFVESRCEDGQTAWVQHKGPGIMCTTGSGRMIRPWKEQQ